MRILLWTLVGLLICTSCASQGWQPSPGFKDGIYLGQGKDASLLMAMNKAKMDAVKKFIVDYLGPQGEIDSKEAKALYQTSNPNPFVYAETMETTSRERLDGLYNYAAKIKVHKGNILSSLGVKAPVEQMDQYHFDVNSIITERIRDLKYAVTVQGEGLSLSIKDFTSSLVKKFLIENGRQVFDEENLADVAVIATVTGETESKEKQHFASVTVQITSHLRSTGQVLASLYQTSQRTFSNVSANAALESALMAVSFTIKDRLIAMENASFSRNPGDLFRQTILLEGITPSQLGAVTKLLKTKERVEMVKVMSGTQEFTNLAVVYYGKNDELSEVMVSIFTSVPGLEGWVRKSLSQSTLVFGGK